MKRRLFTLLALFAPVAAVAQTAPATPAAPAAPRKKLHEKTWAELTRRQHERLLPGFGNPPPTAAEAGPRWDAMDARQRRAVMRAVRQAHH